MESIKVPTVFFRAVRSKEECKYIIENSDHIESIIKQHNRKNRIIYILLDNMKISEGIETYQLKLRQYSGDIYSMRRMFEHSEELLQFSRTLLPARQIDLNKRYDIQKNGQRVVAAAVKYYMCHDIDGIDVGISNILDLQDGESFYIWGGGEYGISLYHYLTKRKAKIKGIIDNNCLIREKLVSRNISFISPWNIEKGSKIFVSIVNEQSNIEILEQISEKECKVFTYRDFLRL